MYIFASMDYIDLGISKTNIYKEVYRITAYTGKLAGDIEKISLTTDDSILDVYFLEAMSAIGGFAENKIVYTSDSVYFSAPSNWDDEKEPALISAIELYIENYILFKWFAICKVDEAEKYAQPLSVQQTAIIKHINARYKPSK